MTNKPIITERLNGKFEDIPYIDIYSFDNDINCIITKLKDIQKAGKKHGYHTITMQIIRSYDSFEPDDIEIYGHRDETEEETKKRLAKNRKARAKAKETKKKKEEEEKALLAKLKEKYPNV